MARCAFAKEMLTLLSGPVKQERSVLTGVRGVRSTRLGAMIPTPDCGPFPSYRRNDLKQKPPGAKPRQVVSSQDRLPDVHATMRRGQLQVTGRKADARRLACVTDAGDWRSLRCAALLIEGGKAPHPARENAEERPDPWGHKARLTA